MSAKVISGPTSGPKRPSLAERRESFLEQANEQIQHVEETPFVATNITQCQVEKFTALFEKYFDLDKDGYITERDIEHLNQKIFDYTEWNPEDPKAKKLIEYYNDLFKCLLGEINKEFQTDEFKKDKISLNDWLNMWNTIMHRALAIFHLPQWVQVMPFNMFSFIDKYGRGHVTKQNLFEFYTDFMGLDDKRGKTVSDNAWSQMTGNGDFKLNLELYAMAFSNFLFAKNHYGPGLYILGTFEECVKVKGFKVDLSAVAED